MFIVRYGFLRSSCLLQYILWHLLGGYFYHRAEYNVSQMQLSSASRFRRNTEVPIVNANETETQILPKTAFILTAKKKKTWVMLSEECVYKC